MNANPPKKSFFNMCCSIFIFALLFLLLIIDFVQISALNTIDDKIYALNKRLVNCNEACGAQYVSYGQNCCIYYNLRTCSDLSSCIVNILSIRLVQRNDIIGKIWVFSILSFVMTIGFFILVKRGCCKTTNRAVSIRQPLYHNVTNNINRSQQMNQPRQKRGNVDFESFAYQDDQDTCCICLCIRDWVAKQKNCPICRSSQ